MSCQPLSVLELGARAIRVASWMSSTHVLLLRWQPLPAIDVYICILADECTWRSPRLTRYGTTVRLFRNQQLGNAICCRSETFPPKCFRPTCSSGKRIGHRSTAYAGTSSRVGRNPCKDARMAAPRGPWRALRCTHTMGRRLRALPSKLTRHVSSCTDQGPGMQQPKPATIAQERRVASRRAGHAECALAHAWHTYFYASGARPSESEQENAARLRDAARSRQPRRDGDG